MPHILWKKDDESPFEKVYFMLLPLQGAFTGYMRTQGDALG